MILTEERITNVIKAQRSNMVFNYQTLKDKQDKEWCIINNMGHFIHYYRSVVVALRFSEDQKSVEELMLCNVVNNKIIPLVNTMTLYNPETKNIDKINNEQAEQMIREIINNDLDSALIYLTRYSGAMNPITSNLNDTLMIYNSGHTVVLSKEKIIAQNNGFVIGGNRFIIVGTDEIIKLDSYPDSVLYTEIVDKDGKDYLLYTQDDKLWVRDSVINEQIVSFVGSKNLSGILKSAGGNEYYVPLGFIKYSREIFNYIDVMGQTSNIFTYENMEPAVHRAYRFGDLIDSGIIFKDIKKVVVAGMVFDISQEEIEKIYMNQLGIYIIDDGSVKYADYSNIEAHIRLSEKENEYAICLNESEIHYIDKDRLIKHKSYNNSEIYIFDSAVGKKYAICVYDGIVDRIDNVGDKGVFGIELEKENILVITYQHSDSILPEYKLYTLVNGNTIISTNIEIGIVDTFKEAKELTIANSQIIILTKDDRRFVLSLNPFGWY